MKKGLSILIVLCMLCGLCSFSLPVFSSTNVEKQLISPIADGCYDTYSAGAWKGVDNQNLYVTVSSNEAPGSRQSFLMFDISDVNDCVSEGKSVKRAYVKLTMKSMNAGYNNYNATDNPDAEGPRVSLFAYENDNWDEEGINLPTPLTKSAAEANVVSVNPLDTSLNYASIPNQATNYPFELDITDHLKALSEAGNDDYMSFEMGYRSKWFKSGTYIVYSREASYAEYRPQLVVEYEDKKLEVADVRVSNGDNPVEVSTVSISESAAKWSENPSSDEGTLLESVTDDLAEGDGLVSYKLNMKSMDADTGAIIFRGHNGSGNASFLKVTLADGSEQKFIPQMSAEVSSATPDTPIALSSATAITIRKVTSAAFVRFDLSTLIDRVDEITAVSLVIKPQTVASTNFVVAVSKICTDTWDCSTLTWNNMPGSFELSETNAVEGPAIRLEADVVNNLETTESCTAVFAFYRTDVAGFKNLREIKTTDLTLAAGETATVSADFVVPKAPDGECYDGQVILVDNLDNIKPLDKKHETDTTCTVHINETFDSYTDEGVPSIDGFSGDVADGRIESSISLEDWGNCLRLTSVEGNAPYVSVQTGTLPKKYSIAFDIMLAGSDGIRELSLIDSDGTEAVLLSIDSKNALVCGSNVASLKNSDFYRLQLDVNQVDSSVSVSLDGKKLAKVALGSDLSTQASAISFKQGSNGSTSTMFVDNLAVFSASEPSQTELIVPEEFGVAITRILQSSVVMTAFENKAIKYNVATTTENPLVVDGDTALIPLEDAAKLLGGSADVSGSGASLSVNGISAQFEKDSSVAVCGGEEIALSAPVSAIGDVLYIAAKDFALAFGLNSFESDHGIAVISQNDYSSTLGSNETALESLVRRVCYSRPSRDKILNDFIAGGMGETHPSLVVGENGFEEIKERINTNEEFRDMYQTLKDSTESIVNLDTITYTRSDGRRLDDAQVMAIRYLPRLYLMYNLSGEEKYAESAWRQLEMLCSDDYPEWGTATAQHLNVAELSSAVMLGYDWLYDWLGEERREIVRQALTEKGLNAGKAFLDDDKWWLESVWNWNTSMASGIGVTCIGMLSEEPLLSAELLSEYLRSMEYSLSSFYPDGAWDEGIGYWQYVITNLTMLTSSLDKVLADDYGIFNTPGLGETPYFPMHCTGPVGIFNFHDTGEETHSPELGFFAKKLNNPDLMTYLGSRFDKVTPKFNCLLWYDPEWDSGVEIEIPTDKFYENMQMMFMRQNWTDDAIYTGLHAGSNDVGHAHLDSGSFIIDALGERWVSDPGRDGLSYQTYDDTKYDIWALRTESHNCVVINPDLDGGQLIESYSPITETKISDDSVFAITDLTNAYSEDASSYKRGLALTDGREVVVVRDEISLIESGDIRWSVTTATDVTISEDGKSAILSENGKYMYVAIAEGDGVFTKMDAAPLSTSPNPDGQVSRAGLTQLEIWQTGVTDVNLTVVFIPLGTSAEFSGALPEIGALSTWNTIY